ncbi:MAG: hypothetical protein KatS3mg105_3828 [Gemmatales bacterium]|nr:MAG: hypothetical protein KatS3mg105_3828 [Gemmatales bacterium]
MKLSNVWRNLRWGEFSASEGRSGLAHLESYTTQYREWGNGPTIVLVHGLAGGMELLGPLARCLAQRFRVICYQLRGDEKCFALRQRFGMSDLVEDLAQFLDWRALEKPILLGVSFGGVLALEFAARYPWRLHNLIVQGVGARLEKGLLQSVRAGGVIALSVAARQRFRQSVFQFAFWWARRKSVV